MTCRLGIFGPNRKLTNVCMTELLRRLHAHSAVIADRVRIFVQPVDDADDADWPHVDVLLAYSNDERCLSALLRFVDRTRPRRVVNDIDAQLGVLKSRVDVINALLVANVNVCESIVIDHLDAAVSSRLIETAETLSLGDCVIRKPFVEKPVDESNHNVRVYLPNDAGAVLLFRKSRSEASARDPQCNRVRRDACYVYQPFIETGGIDIKVYTLGAHRRAFAEARVAPTAAREVERDPATGKERRIAAELSDAEQAMVVRAAGAVGHAACGLDLLRDVRSGETFVCDVNGWSHVYADEYFDSAVAFLIEEQCSSSSSSNDEWNGPAGEAVPCTGGVDVHDERRSDVLAADTERIASASGDTRPDRDAN